MLKKLLVLFAPVLVSACASFPSGVAMPDAHTTAGQSYEPELKQNAKYVGVYPIEKSGVLVEQQATLYASTWRKASRELLGERDVANNSQFAMTIASAYNTAKSQVQPAKWWLAGAGGIGLLSDRYQIEAQALAYNQGAGAMECVRSEVAAIPASLWKVFDPDGALLIAPSDIKGAPDAVIAHDTLASLFRTSNQKMSTIASRVRDVVSAKKVSVPSVEEITRAVTAKEAEKPKADNQAKALSDQLKTARTTVQADMQRLATALQSAEKSKDNANMLILTPELRRASARFKALDETADIPESAYAAALKLPKALDECVSKIAEK